MNIERRFVKGVKVRAKDSEKPGIEGYASVFNQDYATGWFVETIKPGAFTRALREKQDVRCLFNHNPDNLLGRSASGTLRMVEDSTGLHFECDTDPEMRIAADVQAMIERGDLDGCSFGFEVTKQTWREEKNSDGQMVCYRDIEDVNLYDVGPVTYPAYDGTSVSARSTSSAAALWPQGVPAEIRSHVPELQSDEKLPKSKRDAVDGEEPCDCPCGPCDDGDCDNCNCEGCDSDTCASESCRCDEVQRALRARLRIAHSE